MPECFFKTRQQVANGDNNSKQAVQVPNVNSVYRQGNTLFAPNANGKIVGRPIADMVTEMNVPGTSDKIRIPGTVEQVFHYIHTNFPNYIWADVEDPNTKSSKVPYMGNTVYCNISLHLRLNVSDPNLTGVFPHPLGQLESCLVLSIVNTPLFFVSLQHNPSISTKRTNTMAPWHRMLSPISKLNFITHSLNSLPQYRYCPW
jgi:hypothetical protein